MVSHENLWETIAAWWFGTMEFMTFHILGISSSHLTHIFQYGSKPPTSIGYIGDPQLYMIYYILNNLGGMHMQAARNELQMIDVPYTIWLFNIAMQNGPIYRWFTYLKKVIFHSYLSLPEGNSYVGFLIFLAGKEKG
jgi:hypothetical protein